VEVRKTEIMGEPGIAASSPAAPTEAAVQTVP